MADLKLRTEAAIVQAKELTITAMQHGMIPSSKDPEETARFVYAFYSALFKELTE